ncbi:hypothetical protein AC579_9154 [Pseudocercospora musae]|uniref:Uncharacterized protein n=1 Tax=Pseudocercospora musae TaxID=113226 RepID=A0A139I6U0_9PEZI|nr:hypothetical protein AC579_9154 [Pseudocercospora musae]
MYTDHPFHELIERWIIVVRPEAVLYFALIRGLEHSLLIVEKLIERESVDFSDFYQLIASVLFHKIWLAIRLKHATGVVTVKGFLTDMAAAFVEACADATGKDILKQLSQAFKIIG